MTSPHDSAFSDIGFDISHNNGTNLNFRKMRDGGGRQTAFLKLTEGTGFVDPMFAAHVRRIIDAGVDFDLAAYHFAHAGSADDQIDFFLDSFVDQIAKVGSGAPPFHFMIDAERGKNAPNESVIRGMIDALTSYEIPNPIIYCGFDFFSKAWPDLRPCGCFLAAYNARPISPLPWRTPSKNSFGFDWWQYTGDALGPWAGDIPGGSHGMDLSCFNKAKHPEGAKTWWASELAKLTQPS